MLEVQKLNWDTDFFGIAVGKLEVESNERSIKEIDFQTLKQNFNLIYVFSTRELQNESNLFEDCKIILSYKIFSKFESESKVLSYNGESNAHLLKLALQSGEYSRFKLDPNFEHTMFTQLYTKWLKSSIDRSISDEFFIVNNDVEEKPIGFITVAQKGNYCEIGLLAVDSKYRGQGIGKKLIHRVVNYCIENGYDELRVPTQLRNLKALHFYQKLGFEIVNKTFIYHYWV